MPFRLSSGLTVFGEHENIFLFQLIIVAEYLGRAQVCGQKSEDNIKFQLVDKITQFQHQ